MHLCPSKSAFCLPLPVLPGWPRTKIAQGTTSQSPQNSFWYSPPQSSWSEPRVALKYFEKLRRQTLLTVCWVVGHLSMVILTGKQSKMIASLGLRVNRLGNSQVFFCHGDELGSFLCPLLGCISSHLHLLVWGLPVHWQNVYLEMPSFQGGACLFPNIHFKNFCLTKSSFYNVPIL